MFPIVRREQFGPTTFLWDVKAPDLARAARAGHFVMARIDQRGERIPLTVADFDRERGTVTVVIQAIGKTTYEMLALKEGEPILDFIGPLGLPSKIHRLDGTVVLVGGGLGVAPVFPQLREYKRQGNRTISIVGFRTRRSRSRALNASSGPAAANATFATAAGEASSSGTARSSSSGRRRKSWWLYRTGASGQSATGVPISMST